MAAQDGAEFNVVAIDYGIKRNILRQLAGNACKVTVVPATTSADDILALKPDGIFLSNGPGDPAATGEYAVPVIRALIEQETGLRHLPRPPDAGARGRRQDHENASGPSRRQSSGERPVTGKVEITSMNHGFAVDRRDAAGQRRGDPRFPVRRLELRPGVEGPAGVLGAVSSGSLARSARQPLLFNRFVDMMRERQARCS